MDFVCGCQSLRNKERQTGMKISVWLMICYALTLLDDLFCKKNDANGILCLYPQKWVVNLQGFAII